METMANEQKAIDENRLNKNVSELEKDTEAEYMLQLSQKMLEEVKVLEIEESDRDKEGNLLVHPEGPISNLGRQSELYWRMARTETFKSFFGDWEHDPRSSSKIVDENGEPLVVFRGVDKDLSFGEFYNREFYESDNITQARKGVHVTPSRKLASAYVKRFERFERGGEGGIYALFVNSRKPAEQDSLRANIQKELEEMLHEFLYIPRKYFKIPQFSLGLCDSVIGMNRRLVTEEKDIDPNSKKMEDVFEMVVRNPRQILILPSPFEKSSAAGTQ